MVLLKDGYSVTYFCRKDEKRKNNWKNMMEKVNIMYTFLEKK